MELRDLREFYDPDLYLPLGGKKYRVPAPTMEQAERLQPLVLTEGLSEDQELAEIRELFGPLHDELLADGVKWTEYLHLGKTALLWAGSNERVASSYWHFAQLGQLVDLNKIRGANRAQRRAAGKAAVKKSVGARTKRAG